LNLKLEDGCFDPATDPSGDYNKRDLCIK